jgi:leader peptidase (prepilin peptidase)/N-methyltransferase
MNPITDIFYPVLAVVFGLVLGSFFNVLIYRIPRKESIVWPPSHCPQCGRRIRPHENIPLLSYLLLRGRCAGCKKRIPAQYPAVELLTAAATLCIYFRYIVPSIAVPHTTWTIVTLVMQTSVLLIVIPIAFIDFSHFIIPDSITLPGLAAGALVSLLPGGISPLDAFFGIIAGGGSLFVIGLIGEWIFKKGEAMGGGDVKLMAFCGAVFGWKTALLTIVLGSFVGATIGIALIAVKVFPRDHKIPFGPFLACGMWIAVFAGTRLLSAFLLLVDNLTGS